MLTLLGLVIVVSIVYVSLRSWESAIERRVFEDDPVEKMFAPIEEQDK